MVLNMSEGEQRADNDNDSTLAAQLSNFLTLSAVLLRSHNTKLITELIAMAVGDLALTATFSAFYQPSNTNRPLVAINNGKRLSATATWQLLAQLSFVTDPFEGFSVTKSFPLEDDLQTELKAKYLYVAPVRNPSQQYGLLLAGVNNELDPIQVNFLAALGDLAAIALENAVRFDLLQQTVTENRLVNEIATALAGSLNPEELFEVFIQHLQPYLTFERASLMLLDPEQQHFGILFGWNNKPGRTRRGQMAEMEIVGSPLEQAIRSQEIVVDVAVPSTAKITADPVFANDMQSLMVIPLVTKGRVVGTLNLATTRKEAYSDFTRLPITLLAKLVAHLALALSNSMLYEEQQISAETDSRVGVYNHDFFDRQIEIQLKKASQQSYRLALLMIDMDNLKLVNDQYGHQAGDAALRHLAKTITESVRNTDVVARYGGDEFSVLLAGCSPKGLEIVSEKIRQGVRNTPLALPSNTKIQLTVSIGGAIYPDDAANAPDLLNKADAAMYVAKKKRDQVRLGAKARLVRLPKAQLNSIEPERELPADSDAETIILQQN